MLYEVITLHLGHAGLTTHQDHLVDLVGGDAGVLQCLFARPDGTRDQFLHQGLQLGAGQLDVEVLGTAGIRRDSYNFV